MHEFGNATMSKRKQVKASYWQASIRYREVLNPDAPESEREYGTWRQKHKTLGIECSMEPGDMTGERLARQAMNEWRDALIEEDKKADLKAAEAARLAAEIEQAKAIPSLGDLADEYIYYVENQKEKPAEASTVYGYRCELRAKVLRYDISSMRIDQIEEDDVRAWVNELRKDGYSPVSIRKALVLVRSSLKYAVKNGRIAKNPSEGISVPKGKHKPNAIIEKQRSMLAAVLETADQAPHIVGINVAFYTGMREAEICALRWRDVDLEGGTLTVRSALGKVSGHYYYKPPKNENSGRVVPIPKPLVESLRKRHAKVLEEAMQVSRHPDIDDMFVLGTIERGKNGQYTFYKPSALWRKWKGLATLLGLKGTQGEPPTFHDLRHTWATTAIREGVDIKTVSDILGHADAAMTLNVYADADQSAKRNAADKVSAALGQGKEGYGQVLTMKPTGTEQ